MAFNTSILTITLNGTGTEIPTLNVTDPYQSYLITGSATAIGNYGIVPTGTPQLGTTFLFNYTGTLDITTNSKTFTLFGTNITQLQLTKTWEASCYYNGSAWEVDLKLDFSQAGIIDTNNLADLSVTTNKLANLAVTSTKIAADAVTTVKVLDSNITTNKLANDAVTTSKVLDSNITTSKLNNNAVTNAKLAQMAAYTIKGNNTGSTADPQDISASTLINANAWSLTGNSGTVAGTNFIGTTDAIDLVFKVNNIGHGRLNLSLNNLSFGRDSLLSAASAVYNVAIGRNNLTSLTTGDFNVAIGHNTLVSNIAGSGNTSVGNGSSAATIGSYNSVLGSSAFQSNTSGSYNSILGFSSLVLNETGDENVAFGNNAGATIVSGNENTLIGSYADVNTGNATNRIALGANATATADNQFAITSTITDVQFTNATINSKGLTISNKTINTTTGDSATINTVAGRFRKDSSGSTFTLTNSYITANSIIILCPANAAIDGTATSWTVSASSGSASIVFNAAPTSDFDMNFWVIN